MAALRERGGSVVGCRVALLVGSGNNGADALFAGARLAERGASVRAVVVGDRHHELAARALRRAGGRLAGADAGDLSPAMQDLDWAEVVIDGILGIGARGAPRDPARRLLEAANAAGALRIAVDLPTGVDGDTGAVPDVAFRADLTVTFAAYKPGLLLAPGKEFAGRVDLVGIGIDDALDEPVAFAMERADVAQWLPVPGFEDHKYRRGVAGIAAGSHDYRGAALLCASAALAGPTGMTVLLDRRDGVADLVVSQHPEVVRSEQVQGRVTAWACGPGFTGSRADLQAIEATLRTGCPVVLDAGALGLLASSADLRDLVRTRAGVTILTPHDGEFARLGGDPGLDRLSAARDLARRLDAVVVRKGPGTVIAAPGGDCFIDLAGTPALATAGSGDVLAGLLASLLAAAQARGRLHSASAVAEAVAAGCWLHGTAGTLAADSGCATASGIASALHRVLPPSSGAGVGAEQPDPRTGQLGHAAGGT
jgi:hydroxyethylthiazole kinase-like uncharacterized protein yjeF